jgi:hypothetical protein
VAQEADEAEGEVDGEAPLDVIVDLWAGSYTLGSFSDAGTFLAYVDRQAARLQEIRIQGERYFAGLEDKTDEG